MGCECAKRRIGADIEAAKGLRVWEREPKLRMPG
jgi:hypothetical protein